MKLRKLLFSLLAVVLLVASCDFILDIFGEDDDTGIEYEISTDPNSNVLLRATNESNDVFVLIGEKDSKGLAKSITEVMVQEHNKKTPTSFQYDKNYRPIKVVADNGVVMNFEWLSSTKAALTVVEPNTGEQINTMIDLEAEPKSKSPSVAPHFTKRSGEVQMEVCPIQSPEAPSSVSSMIQTKAGGDIEGDIYYTHCGQPRWGDCFVKVYSVPEIQLKYLIGTYPAHITSEKGHHSFVIPASDKPSIDLGEIASSIDFYMGYVCASESNGQLLTHFQNLICPAISAGTLAFPATSPAAPAVLAACSGSTAALQLYCSTLGAGLDGGDSLGSAIAEKTGLSELDFEISGSLTIIPCVPCFDPNKSYISGNVVIYTGGPLNCTIEEGGSPSIGSFTLNPSAPSDGQDYVAKAMLLCVPAGTKVTMSIVGTDGYEDSKSYTISSEQESYEATLRVPGADTGVRDQCTVTMVTPDGSKYTKNASLVFGD